MRLTEKQRGTLGKVFLNASNAILVAWLLGSFSGQAFRVKIFACGLVLYILTIISALWIDR